MQNQIEQLFSIIFDRISDEEFKLDNIEMNTDSEASLKKTTTKLYLSVESIQTHYKRVVTDGVIRLKCKQEDIRPNAIFDIRESGETLRKSDDKCEKRIYFVDYFFQTDPYAIHVEKNIEVNLLNPKEYESYCNHEIGDNEQCIYSGFIETEPSHLIATLRIFICISKEDKNKIRKLIKSNMLSELRLGIRFDCYKETGEFNVESLKKNLMGAYFDEGYIEKLNKMFFVSKNGKDIENSNVYLDVNACEDQLCRAKLVDLEFSEEYVVNTENKTEDKSNIKSNIEDKNETQNKILKRINMLLIVVVAIFLILLIKDFS